MVETLLCLNGVALLFLYRTIGRLVGRILALTYLTYMAVFTVLKPALLYYFDLYFPYSTNERPAVEALLIGSLIFLVVQWLGIRLLAHVKAPPFILRCFDFDAADKRGIVVAFVALMIVSFVGCTIKFSSATYLFSAVDSFEASLNLANGSWYITALAESLFFGLLMVVGRTYWRYPMLRSLGIMLATLLFTFFWVKATARTGALVVIISWMCCYFSVQQQRRLNVVYIGLAGYALLILLYLTNLVRTGELGALNVNTAIFGAIVAAASDLGPVDNAVLLYSDMAKHSYLYFVQTLGALTPLVLIPSALFPFKPVADKDAELTRIFFPDGADTAFYHEGSTLTFTVPASGYADAGYLGVVVASVLFVLLFCWYLWILRQGSRSARLIAAYLLIVHIVGFRLSIESALVSFYTNLLLFGLTRRLALFAGHFLPGAKPRRPRLALPTNES